MIMFNVTNKFIEWITLLLKQCRKFNNVVLQNLLKKRYIIRDAANRRESRKYVQKIFKEVKNCRINERNQLNFIYNDINIEIRMNNLRRSRDIIIINNYFKKFNEFKYNWWVKKDKIMRINDKIDN